MLETINIIDISILKYFIDVRTPWLTYVMLLFSRLGDEPIAYGSVVLVILLLLIKRQSWEAAWFSLSMIFSAALNSGIKEAVGRVRPSLDPVLIRQDFSFPSGHAMNSIVFFGLLTCLLFKYVTSKPQKLFIVFLGLTLSLLMGISRVYLGVHFASDVFVGFILGGSVLGIAVAVGKVKNRSLHANN